MRFTLRWMQRGWSGIVVTVFAASIALAACSSTGVAAHRLGSTKPSTTSTKQSSPRSSRVSTSPSAALAPPVTIPGTAATRKVAQSVIKAVLAGFVSRNWGALYDLAASQIQQSQSRKAFISSMQSQAMPQIVSGSVSGSGSESIQNATNYWTQGVVLEVRNGSGLPKTYTAQIELIEQGGTWRFLTTSTPSPSS